MKPPVLIIDDEKLQRELVSGFLKENEYPVFEAGTLAEAKTILSSQYIGIALVDRRLPDGDGVEFIKDMKQLSPHTVFVVITAYGDIPSTVKGMKDGAVDYIEKPVNLKHLLEILKSSSELLFLREDIKKVEEVAISLPDYFICQSPAMRHILSLVSRVAPTETSILLEGETGVGKEMVARLVHKLSPRKDGAFVPVNCAAIPEGLLESELFGYEKGAFTGAQTEKPGIFEEADGGTLFLDEVTELPLPLQAKLLRFLQDGSFRRLGGRKQMHSSVRVISATNRNIRELTAQARFREDLLWRLDVIHIKIPPLRERREDILPLANFFLERFSKRDKKKISGFTPSAIKKLESSSFPGNIRQLANAIEYAVATSRGDAITEEDLPPLERGAENRSLKEIEKQHIEHILRLCSYNISKAAEILGIHRNTLYQKMQEYRIKKEKE